MKTSIIIPCFNEGKRLQADVFVQFINQNPSYYICFVDDGSEDETLKVIHRIQQKSLFPQHVQVLALAENKGKAEAVRIGILHMLKDTSFDVFGYLDADLSTSLEEFTQLTTILNSLETHIVCGSRVKRMGAVIKRVGVRHYGGRILATMISWTLGLPFYDTQCGAKVFTREIATLIFDIPFHSRWLFDVEVFLRMKKYYGDQQIASMIYEYPLLNWTHKNDSKLSWSDALIAPWQLLRLHFKYRAIAYDEKLRLVNA